MTGVNKMESNGLEADNSYNEVPYESFAYPQTHIDNLYTVANMFGMQPTDFRHAKVLEIGCACGGNLAPLANAFPESQFLGIDISEEQIAQANAMKDALQLDNLDFQVHDIKRFKPKKRSDRYDYIICHGVYSWVSDEIRQSILKVCREYLTENGIAIISYNTLPGWNAVRSLREMMMYHTKRFASPAEKISQAKFLLEFLISNVHENNAAYKTVIENELKVLEATNNTYLFHEHLEAENVQFYLSDFVEQLRENELEYVGDTNVSSMFIGNLSQDAIAKLQAVNDIVAQEQYMDFINNRRFRSSIISRKDVKINRTLRKEQILDYHLSFAQTVRVTGKNVEETIRFAIGAGFFETRDKVSSALFLTLAEQNGLPIAAKELMEKVAEKYAIREKDRIAAVLVGHGLQLSLKGFIKISSYSPECVMTISDKPEIYKVARYEAQMHNYTRSKVTNVLGNTISTDMSTNIIISNLDGTKTIADVVELLIEKEKEGIISVQENGKKITDERKIKVAFEKVMELLLPKLANNFFIVG